MGIEIERKFLLKNDQWRDAADAGTVFCQGYLNADDKASVRVRIEGDQANINIKSATLGQYRQEYEYPIPVSDARNILADLCIGPLIEKTRFAIQTHGKCWEIDVFTGDNAGLVVAEVELDEIDEAIELPSWVGEEVTDDKRYYNVSLVTHPFKDW